MRTGVAVQVSGSKDTNIFTRSCIMTIHECTVLYRVVHHTVCNRPIHCCQDFRNSPFSHMIRMASCTHYRMAAIGLRRTTKQRRYTEFELMTFIPEVMLAMYPKERDAQVSAIHLDSVRRPGTATDPPKVYA